MQTIIAATANQDTTKAHNVCGPKQAAVCGLSAQCRMILKAAAFALICCLAQAQVTSATVALHVHRDRLVNSNRISRTRHESIDDIDIGKLREFADAQAAISQLSPVILVPGDGGSRLEAKLDRYSVAHKYCERRSSDWFDLWLSLSSLVPFALDCWSDK